MRTTDQLRFGRFQVLLLYSILFFSLFFLPRRQASPNMFINGAPRFHKSIAFLSAYTRVVSSSSSPLQSLSNNRLHTSARTSLPFKTRSVHPTTKFYAMTNVAAKPTTEQSSSQQITGPTWVLEYDSSQDPTLLADVEAATEYISKMEQIADKIKHLVPDASSLTMKKAQDADLIPSLISMFKYYWQTLILLSNVSTYAGCVSSVDGSDEAAKKLSNDMQMLFSRAKQAYESASLILDSCPDDIFDQFLESDKDAKASEYLLRHSRKMKDHRLSLEEENMITSLAVTGHSAWGNLYTDLSSILKVNMKMKDGSISTMGIASADAMRDNPDEEIRKNSWEAIRAAWLPHQETCAAALNAITGWRLELYKKRSFDSFLNASMHSNRMSIDTLNALLKAIEGKVEAGRRALRLQANALGKERLELWDLFAPAPVSKDVGRVYTFDEGIDLIANAVGKVDEKAGKFVRMMQENKWIEASRGDKKRPGAYCTGFAKTRTPRVYLSDYNGRSALLLTLAHELGHAFHSWQMRDMPRPQTSYPMNLAETASIFFETVVSNALLEQTESAEEKFSILWGQAESLATFVLNIPARYRFEEELNKRRSWGKVSASEIDNIMVEAWERYYGDALNGTERVGVFSQSKLHFYLTGISFYNWPYSFGYLFALGVYASYENGDKNSFASIYRDLLRDTGRLDAENVVEKHLGGRIDEPEFWKQAIGVAEKSLDMMEQVSKQL